MQELSAFRFLQILIVFIFFAILLVEFAINHRLKPNKTNNNAEEQRSFRKMIANGEATLSSLTADYLLILGGLILALLICLIGLIILG